jgi:hypothetical protein
MAQQGGTTNAWFQLTPDSSGSYIHGTWSRLASMRDTRLYFPSEVLDDGRVFVAGGEYGAGTRTGEIYDPVSNTWTPIPGRPLGDIGDIPSEMLPDGSVLVGYRADGRTNIYNPWTNSWSAGATKLRNSRSSEETWVLLPDQSILTYEIYNGTHAQRYVPYLTPPQWVDAGNLPFPLQAGLELGPAFLLPDGRAFFVGANGRTALYTPGPGPLDPGSWEAGPTFPGNLGAWDAPGAMMPNGVVLLAVGPQNYGSPTSFFEYDPTTNALTRVTSPPGFTGPAFVNRMLMLPSGDVLVTNSSNQLWVYTPDGSPDPSWKPTVSEVDDNGDGTFLLFGTQLNGISEGASYGDDAEMSSNYPIIQLVDNSGNVVFARTSYWSSVGVATGDTPEYTFFTPPAGLNPGNYSLYVVTNGIASDPFPFTYGGGQPGIPGGSGPGGRALSSRPAPVQAMTHASLSATTGIDEAVRSAAVASTGFDTLRTTLHDQGATPATMTAEMGTARLDGQAASDARILEALATDSAQNLQAKLFLGGSSSASSLAGKTDRALDAFFLTQPLDASLLEI